MKINIFKISLLIAFAVILLSGLHKNAFAHEAGNITVADLGITDVGTLPSSGTYFLKEWSRAFGRFFTFNSVKKTELEMRISNEIAAEALTILETKPDDEKTLATALENYVKAGERLRAKFMSLKETSENKNVEKLLFRLEEQLSNHGAILNEIEERWNTDPYVETTKTVNPQAAKDNHLQGAVDMMRTKLLEITVSAADKDKNIQEKASAQISIAEIAIKELTVRLDPTPARISTNVTTERQTPKRDFGDRMKAGLETAGGVLANGKSKLERAKEAFKEGKFGEAYGNAQAAEVIAKNGLRFIETILRPDLGGLEDGVKITPPSMPAVPDNARR